MPDAHAVAVVPSPDFQKLEMLVLNSVRSPQSKRAYKRALEDFLAWYRAGGYPALAKAVVQRYRAELEQSGLAPSTINRSRTRFGSRTRSAVTRSWLTPDPAR